LLFSCEAKDRSTGSNPISHDIWSSLLKDAVSQDGRFNYNLIIEKRDSFESYLSLLRSNHPDTSNWNREEQLAYWINAYNAFTVKVIIENYPLYSIKDLNKTISIPFVNTIWDLEFIDIESVNYSLNDIEHSILRSKFDDPRIHFAINCASFSCPNIRNEAFTAEKLSKQLDEQARIFINDRSKNLLGIKKASLSKIFLWYQMDFTNNTSLIEYLNKYSTVRIHENADISYMDYDWRLNN
jgi:hypothetical protein